MVRIKIGSLFKEDFWNYLHEQHLYRKKHCVTSFDELRLGIRTGLRFLNLF